jgi:ATP-dependent Clp protease protease subunit
MQVDNQQWYLEHGDALAEQGIKVLMSAMDADSVRPVVEWILHENHVRKKKHKELLLMICSEGGDIGETFALIDVMQASTVPIKTVGLGCVASAGLMVFMAGTPGRRILTPNTSILSHQFEWGSEGKSHELFATMKEFELTQRRMLAHYKKCTGLDQDTIQKVLLPPHDVWLTAEEALEHGICDAVSGANQR